MIAVKFLPLTFSLLALFVTAGELPKLDLDLEPCFNGGVSATGTFPTQTMQDQIDAYLAWSPQTGRPFYLFQVAGDGLAAP